MLRYLIILFFIFFFTNTQANNKNRIVENLKKIDNLNFNFEQNINGKIEYGKCTIEYPKKIEGSVQKTTGAVVNAPLVKKIILEMIKILKIPKLKSENILNADINKFYKKYYVSL